MKVNIEVHAEGVEVSAAGYSNSRDAVKACINGVAVSDLLESIGNSALFSNVELSDYIDWADNNSKLSEILDRLSPDEVITWLRDNGHLEDADD